MRGCGRSVLEQVPVLKSEAGEHCGERTAAVLYVRLFRRPEAEKILFAFGGGKAREDGVVRSGSALLDVDPERVDLDPEGSRQVITVITNQESWELLGAADNPAFTLTEDHARNTITVSAGSFGGGVREHTYTVRAGTLEKQFVVSQSAPYKVGAPYLVNGRPVGIVYQVDETGMHGKAYALTVYNLIDKYFMYTAASGFQLEEVYAPLSRTDGLENQRLLMSIPGWETIC